jgi:hypothetical protein
MDSRLGRWANASPGDYLVAVNADAPDVDVEFVAERDEIVNPLGVKGVGEISQVGAAAAIARCSVSTPRSEVAKRASGQDATARAASGWQPLSFSARPLLTTTASPSPGAH